MFVHMMLDAAQMRVLVVGGGAVAARKSAALLAGGAEITLLSPQRQEAAWQAVGADCRWLAEPYTEDFALAGFDLVVAATDQPELNRRLAERCRRLGILCNCASAPDAGSVVLPGVVRGQVFSLAVASVGRLPGLTKKFKAELARFLADYEQTACDAPFGEFLAGLRRQIMRQYTGAQKQELLRGLAELAEHKVELIGGRHDGKDQYDAQAALAWLERQQAGAGADAAGGGAAGGGEPGAANGDLRD